MPEYNVKLGQLGIEVLDEAGGPVLVLSEGAQTDEFVRRLMKLRAALTRIDYPGFEGPTPSDIVIFKTPEEYADRMTIVDFMKGVASDYLTDYDGNGYYGLEDMTSNQFITPSQAVKVAAPQWATHVYWFNK